VGIAHRGRSAIKYVLQDQHWTSALVGGGRVEAVFDKTNTPGVYAVLGTPTAGRMNVNTEALAQVPWPARGNFTGMRVYASSGTAEGFGPSPGFPARFQVRINNAVTSLTIVVTPGVISYDLTAVHSVSFGDLVTLHAQPFSWAAGSAFHGWCQLTFLPVAATAEHPPIDPDSGFLVASAGAGAGAFLAGRWHVAGGPRGPNTQNRTGNPATALMAVPFFVPVSGATFDTLAIAVTDAFNQGQARFGIYEAIGSHDLYPGRLVQATSVQVLLTSEGFKPAAIDSPGPLASDRRYYAAMVVTSFATGVRQIRAVTFGAPIGVGSDGELAFMWGGSYGSYTLPDPFPADIPLATGAAPAIAYGVQSASAIG
jgi:hypothetical protein